MSLLYLIIGLWLYVRIVQYDERVPNRMNFPASRKIFPFFVGELLLFIKLFSPVNPLFIAYCFRKMLDFPDRTRNGDNVSVRELFITFSNGSWTVRTSPNNKENRSSFSLTCNFQDPRITMTMQLQLTAIILNLWQMQAPEDIHRLSVLQ